MQTSSYSKICKTPSITSKKQIGNLLVYLHPEKIHPPTVLEQQVVMFDEI